ncbi:hypothetical protein Nepgr_023135 [Nepenthes gracilis]|uniref:Uncharacterized protein n=1 Tax=Nepenthes gracilis TaxID=150966 RepID=A0AAD3T1H8_NEPGR|nr:hypothetical protein Nepgr_023135 [Nepenthes gracilis]
MHSGKNSHRQVALRPTAFRKIRFRRMYSGNFSLRTQHLSDPRTPSNALRFPPPVLAHSEAKKRTGQIAIRSLDTSKMHSGYLHSGQFHQHMSPLLTASRM